MLWRIAQSLCGPTAVSERGTPRPFRASEGPEQMARLVFVSQCLYMGFIERFSAKKKATIRAGFSRTP